MRIAILEDDPSQLELLSHWLKLAGHHAHTFEQGAPLLRTLEHESFDALLLDWNVPDVSGIEVLRQVRQQLRSSIPVLFGTARNAEQDIVAALRAGADDYLVKPLRRLELLARLDAVTKRNAVETVPDFEVDRFRINGEARQLLRDDEPLELTAKDFDLAVLFLRNVGPAAVPQAYTRTRLGRVAGAQFAHPGYACQPCSQQAAPASRARLEIGGGLRPWVSPGATQIA